MEWIASNLNRMDSRTLGIVSILFAVFLLSLSDAFVKITGDRFGLGQIVFLRSLVAGAVIAAAICTLTHPANLLPRRPTWVWARSLCLTGMWFCYYAALPSMSLPLAAACYYSSPAWMAVMSHFLLREKIGRQQWIAVLFTLAGVALAVSPDVGTLTLVTLLPLLAALFYAIAAILTRSRCQSEAPMVLAWNLNVTLVISSGAVLLGIAQFMPDEQDAFALAVWQPLMPEDWFVFAVLGVFLAIIATAVAQAYRLAPSPTVGVFDTTYLLFAALWSVILIGELPTARETGGMVLVAAGAFLMSVKMHNTEQ